MTKENTKFLITAALPYANGKIHLGHLAGAYLPADIFARYQKLKNRKVVFICGSDEHGVPITITAENEKKTPQEIVDRYHDLNKKAFEKFGMSFDNYSRTSLPIHHETAREFFLKLHEAGVLLEKTEKQLFDPKAEMFLPDRYVEGTCPICKSTDARGDQCEKCGAFLNPLDLIEPRSKISGEKPIVRETSHWYFPLGKYQERLEKYIKEMDAKYGWKDLVLKYCQSWFNEGLQDRAVTRDLDWGVKIPLAGYENKVLYVWFDAVLGYISSTKEWAGKVNENKWKDYWEDEKSIYIAFIGKDNIVFHCIVFPAMLMAWNDVSEDKYILPANVPANEFLNLEGQKFSKSRGWGLDVDEFLEKFQADSLRYSLTMNMPETKDSDFYWKDFQSRHNNELADILGNFVNRTLTFIHKNFNGIVPERKELLKIDIDFLNEVETKPEVIGQFIESYKFRDAALEMMNLARRANKYFNDCEPWKTIKENPDRCATTLNICLQAIKSLSILFEPVLPYTSERIRNIININSKKIKYSWDDAKKSDLPKGHKLNHPEILFTKIEDSVIDEEINKLKSDDLKREINIPPLKPEISIEDFKKVDLRTATIISCEKIKKSEKLLKLQISIGSETRQIIAGIAQHYQPDELVGKKIIVVANLQPAKLMGNESHGMLLAASDEKGNLVFVSTSADIGDGSMVK